MRRDGFLSGALMAGAGCKASGRLLLAVGGQLRFALLFAWWLMAVPGTR